MITIMRLAVAVFLFIAIAYDSLNLRTNFERNAIVAKDAEDYEAVKRMQRVFLGNAAVRIIILIVAIFILVPPHFL